MNHGQIEAIARAAHETNRAFCLAYGDFSQVAWESAPEWQCRSAIEGVSIALAGATPEQQHAAWSASKFADGWVYGPVKDADAKTHPCLVAYGDLPAHQRAKDGLYIAVVRAMAAALAE
jgi:hypothetical protein